MYRAPTFDACVPQELRCWASMTLVIPESLDFPRTRLAVSTRTRSAFGCIGKIAFVQNTEQNTDDLLHERRSDDRWNSGRDQERECRNATDLPAMEVVNLDKRLFISEGVDLTDVCLLFTMAVRRSSCGKRRLKGWGGRFLPDSRQDAGHEYPSGPQRRASDGKQRILTYLTFARKAANLPDNVGTTFTAPKSSPRTSPPTSRPPSKNSPPSPKTSNASSPW